MSERNYKFSWDLIGDLALGRPNLGNLARLEVYRLMQFTFRDVLEQQLGTERADQLFYQAGELAGSEFFDNYCKDMNDFHEFIRSLQIILKDMGIGILRVEKADMAKGFFVLTVSEDLDCSGLPDLNMQICKYDEGFIAGLLGRFTGRHFQVREVDCWCTGDRTCRFHAQIVN